MADKQKVYLLACLSFSRLTEKDETIKKLKAHPGVKALEVLNASKWDVMLTLEIDDTDEMQEIIYNPITGIRYINGVNGASFEKLFVA